MCFWSWPGRAPTGVMAAPGSSFLPPVGGPCWSTWSTWKCIGLSIGGHWSLCWTMCTVVLFWAWALSSWNGPWIRSGGKVGEWNPGLRSAGCTPPWRQSSRCSSCSPAIYGCAWQFMLLSSSPCGTWGASGGAGHWLHHCLHQTARVQGCKAILFSSKRGLSVPVSLPQTTEGAEIAGRCRLAALPAGMQLGFLLDGKRHLSPFTRLQEMQVELLLGPRRFQFQLVQ